jgi:hypothetical protein
MGKQKETATAAYQIRLSENAIRNLDEIINFPETNEN